MPATCALTIVRRQAILDGLNTAIGASGTIKIYDGTQAATPDTAVGAQVLLGTLTFGATPFGSATSATPSVATANAITQDSAADATGTATWARIATSGGTAIMDVNVGTAATTIVLNTASIVSGGPISITAFTMTL